jgi:predicted lipoprotein with Yx(FWY)xxD motif
MMLIAATVLVSACGGSSTGAASSPSAAGSAVTIAVASNAKLGQILVDGSGRTVYLFAADSGTTSSCYNDCAGAWPPVITHGTPQAGAGATASLIGTTTRKDGSLQVTYAGHPLYYFISDKKPGDVTGQAVNGFGGPWYVVAPSGMQVL